MEKGSAAPDALKGGSRKDQLTHIHLHQFSSYTHTRLGQHFVGEINASDANPLSFHPGHMIAGAASGIQHARCGWQMREKTCFKLNNTSRHHSSSRSIPISNLIISG